MTPQLIEIAKINPAPYNPRKISKEAFEGLKQSIKTFGQVENLIINKDHTLISGHQRLEALKALKIEKALCIVVDLTKRQEKKLNVEMNSKYIAGEWDDIKLAEILEELKLDDDYDGLLLNKLEPVDLSDREIDFNAKKVIEVTLESDSDMEDLFDELKDRGYSCRILTL